MLSESRRRANDKYIKANYTKVGISWPNDFVEDLREAISETGLSISQWLREAAEVRMKAMGYEMKHGDYLIDRGDD